MLPRWHIFWGSLLTLVMFLVNPGIYPLYLALVFLSSIFIDVDHYFMAVINTKKWSIKHAFNYHKLQAIIQEKEYRKKIYQKGDFHLFHTLEFHLFIAALSYFWIPFFYVFIGMVFHSSLDVLSLINANRLYRREFLLTKYLLSNKRTI
jgi:hypothetical protein